MFKILPRAFVLGEFKTHRESILFEREQGLMPATQPDVVIERVRREIVSLKRGFMQEAKVSSWGRRPQVVEYFRLKVASFADAHSQLDFAGQGHCGWRSSDICPARGSSVG
jgi:hypothetical protein